jgi:hypothetical protein
MKQTFVAGLFASGEINGNYAAPLADPDADLTTWFARINAGEPYDDALAEDILAEIQAHHSSYYIDHSVRPAPLLISNGWTDDLFPVDEAIRFYNRTRTQYPRAAISLFFSDHGHQRGQSKEEESELRRARQNRWFRYYLKGKGHAPFQGVEALTTTCPKSAAPVGPYSAPSWALIARGEVRLRAAEAATVAPLTGNDAGLPFDPIAGRGACANPPAGTPSGGVAYDVAVKRGFTLLGSPTLIADIASPGPHSQVAARLLDVAPDGHQTLVARGLWRPAPGTSARQVFQLHPNAYRFEAGHTARIELLPADTPYSRPTNGQQPVTFSAAEVRLPVRQRPRGQVKSPADKFVPAGYELARDYLVE